MVLSEEKLRSFGQLKVQETSDVAFVGTSSRQQTKPSSQATINCRVTLYQALRSTVTH
jgi:hypothetical protein